jgi:hypothetical protein
MARPIRCDHCGKEGELEGTYRLAPEGWLQLQQGSSTRSYWADYNARDLCSLACAMGFLQQLETRTPLAESVAEEAAASGETLASA